MRTEQIWPVSGLARKPLLSLFVFTSGRANQMILLPHSLVVTDQS